MVDCFVLLTHALTFKFWFTMAHVFPASKVPNLTCLKDFVKLVFIHLHQRSQLKHIRHLYHIPHLHHHLHLYQLQIARIDRLLDRMDNVLTAHSIQEAKAMAQLVMLTLVLSINT